MSKWEWLLAGSQNCPLCVFLEDTIVSHITETSPSNCWPRAAPREAVRAAGKGLSGAQSVRREARERAVSFGHVGRVPEPRSAHREGRVGLQGRGSCPYNAQTPSSDVLIQR